MNLIYELRRRHVFRSAAMYIVGAWLVIQVADIVFPAFDVPDAGIRYLIYAAVLCFPIAIVFSWFFDVSLGGIRRTLPTGDTDVAGLELQPADHILLVALAVVGVAIVVGSLRHIPEVEDSDAPAMQVDNLPANSVAVLPFANLTESDEQTFLSDGIAEEILQQLAATNRLRVMSRSSSFAFRDSGYAPRRISQQLGVRYLLDGSVRQEGEDVEISVALLDHAGFQVWSDTLRGHLSDVFDLQGQISRDVAERIAGEIIELGQGSGARQTTNSEAYRQYLIGKEYSNKRLPNWQKLARTAFDQAIAEDPSYAPPYAGAALALMVADQPTPWDEREPNIARYIDIALQLAPDLADAYAARGFHAYAKPAQDLRAAVTDFRRAIELDPSHSMAYNWLQVSLRQQGNDDEADQVLLRGAAIDPLNPPLVINAIFRKYEGSGDAEAIERELRKMLEWPDPPGDAYSALGQHLRFNGKLADSVEIGKQNIRAHNFLSRYWELYLPLAELGMFEDAVFWLDVMDRQYGDSLEWSIYARSHRLALNVQRGDIEAARLVYDEYLAPGGKYYGVIEPMIPDDPEAAIWLGQDAVTVGRLELGIEYLAPLLGAPPEAGDMLALIYLHFAYRAIGRGDDAAAVMKEIHALGKELPPEQVLKRARYYLATGQIEAALPILDDVFSLALGQHFQTKHDPVLSDLFGDPRLQPWLLRQETELRRQRALVEAEKRRNDFKAEAFAALENRN
jgi:TolB-like protein/tetratricopeptide (TPR) repeat protein